jgi:hypothetical protein
VRRGVDRKAQFRRDDVSKRKGEEGREEGEERWLTPVIPATQEAEIRRIVVRSQPGQIVLKTLSQKNL